MNPLESVDLFFGSESALFRSEFFGDTNVERRFSPIKKRGLSLVSFILSGAALALGLNAQPAAGKSLFESGWPLSVGDVLGVNKPSYSPREDVCIDSLAVERSSYSLNESSSVIEETNGMISPMNLLKDVTKAALGPSGILRLEDFRHLRPGWDGGSGSSLQLASLDTLDIFFQKTRIKPPNLGLFMSQEGNLIVNWLDSYGKIVELEFDVDGFSAFSESTGETVTLPIGYSAGDFLRVIGYESGSQRASDTGSS